MIFGQYTKKYQLSRWPQVKIVYQAEIEPGTSRSTNFTIRPFSCATLGQGHVPTRHSVEF